MALDDAAIRDLLLATRHIAVAGASDRADRPSHGVLGFPAARGCDAVPANPVLAGRESHGRRGSETDRHMAAA